MFSFLFNLFRFSFQFEPVQDNSGPAAAPGSHAGHPRRSPAARLRIPLTRSPTSPRLHDATARHVDAATTPHVNAAATPRVNTTSTRHINAVTRPAVASTPQPPPLSPVAAATPTPSTSPPPPAPQHHLNPCPTAAQTLLSVVVYVLVTNVIK